MNFIRTHINKILLFLSIASVIIATLSLIVAIRDAYRINNLVASKLTVYHDDVIDYKTVKHEQFKMKSESIAHNAKPSTEDSTNESDSAIELESEPANEESIVNYNDDIESVTSNEDYATQYDEDYCAGEQTTNNSAESNTVAISSNTLVYNGSAYDFTSTSLNGGVLPVGDFSRWELDSRVFLIDMFHPLSSIVQGCYIGDTFQIGNVSYKIFDIEQLVFHYTDTDYVLNRDFDVMLKTCLEDLTEPLTLVIYANAV